MQTTQDSVASVGALEQGHQRLVAWAFIALMAVGAWQMVGALAHHGEMDYPRSWADFKEGRLTTTLEKQLDQKLPARDGLIAFANGLRYALLGGAAEQVRVGRGNWLFLTEELRYDAQGEEHLAARADLLQGVNQALQQRGVTLIVALVPDKARVYAEQLRSGTYPGYNAGRYAQALAALAQRGVPTVDLLKAFETERAQHEVYYRTDTHWNQVGAALAAARIAEAAHALKLSWPKTVYQTTQSTDTVPREGDLMRLMGLAPLPASWRPADDLEAEAQTQAQGGSLSGGGGLFGDVQVPVTLVGTSYSQRGNFQGYLQQSLSAQVLNMAKDGGGFLQAASNYFADDSFKTSPPKLLVWEVPERFLTQPLKDEVGWLVRQGW
jgi:alginate O-acetyltransferase complex protein AlgJ